MSEDLRKAVYEKICPAGWLTSMRLAGVDIGTAQRLKSQMLLHVRGGKHDAKMKGLTTQGITAMDIGALPAPMATPAVVESSKLLAEINAMHAHLASLMAGKGKSTGPGKGSWSSGAGARAQQSGGGKAKGKGKGKGKASDLRPGTKFCHKFAETGRCPHMEQYGYCKFKHVRGVPKALQNVEGVRVEDLGALTYDVAASCWACSLDAKSEESIEQSIAKEIAEINQEMGELAVEQGTEGLTINWGSGFPGQ